MKFVETFPLIAYINLDKRKDRNKDAKREFNKIKINPKRISGEIFLGTTSNWWNGAIGCMLSHYKCLKFALENNKSIFIFEDDVKFINDCNLSILNECCKELSNTNWDMLYLGGNLLKPCYQVNDHLAKLQHCQSTVAYGVNINFIEKLLSYIQLDKIDRPIDCIYSDKVVPENNCYITVPMFSVQRNSYSDIEGQMANYESYLEQRYWANLVRKSP